MPSDTVAVPMHDGQIFSAVDLGNSVLVVAGGSTVTLADGAETTFGKDSISAASTGRAVVVNGTSTLAMSTRTDVAKSSVASNGEAETTAEMEPYTENAAPSDEFSVLMSLLLLTGSCVVVGWL